MIVVAGDIHMGLKDLGHRTGDSVASLGYVLEIASVLSRKSKQFVPVILAGDIWDSVNVHPQVLQSAQFQRKAYNDVPIWYINGNHDRVTPSWTEFLGANQLYDWRTHEIAGLNVLGIDWTLPKDFKEKLKSAISKKKLDLLIVHQFIEDCDDSIITNSIPVSVFDDLDCPVIAGDIHQELIVKNKVVYTSCTNRRAVNQPDGSCLIVATRDEERYIPAKMDTEQVTHINGLDIYRVHLPSRPVVVWKVPGTFEMEDVSKVPLDPAGPWLPYVVLMADAFDPEAVRELNTRADGHAFIIYRKNNVDIIEDEDVEEEKFVLDGSREYARKALKDYPISDGAKDLAMNMLEDEDTFFESLKENFGL